MSLEEEIRRVTQGAQREGWTLEEFLKAVRQEWKRVLMEEAERLRELTQRKFPA